MLPTLRNRTVNGTRIDPWAGGGDPVRIFQPVPEGRIWRGFLHFRHSRVQSSQPLRVRRPDDGGFEVQCLLTARKEGRGVGGVVDQLQARRHGGHL